MSSPDAAALRVVVPPGFAAARLAPPDLSRSPRLALERWQSAGPDGRASLAWGCIAGQAPGWNQDATELAQGKLAELASSTAARMLGRSSPMHVTSTSRDGRERALAGDDGAREAAARTFVVFTRDGTGARAHGCFVACAGGACRDSVGTARVEGALVDAPPAGWVLGSLSLAVHHPKGALAGLGAVLALAVAVAFVTRPRPKRPRRP